MDCRSMSLSSRPAAAWCAGGEVLDAIERGLQTLRGGRLDEVGEGAVREAVQPFFIQRDDLHRDVARRRVELKLVEQRPAEHVGQENIERDGRGVILSREGKTRPAFHGDDAFETLVARQPEEDARIVRIVLDDEQYGVARVDGVPVVLDVLFAYDGQDGDRAGHVACEAGG